MQQIEKLKGTIFSGQKWNSWENWLRSEFPGFTLVDSDTCYPKSVSVNTSLKGKHHGLCWYRYTAESFTHCNGLPCENDIIKQNIQHLLLLLNLCYLEWLLVIPYCLNNILYIMQFYFKNLTTLPWYLLLSITMHLIKFCINNTEMVSNTEILSIPLYAEWDSFRQLKVMII